MKTVFMMGNDSNVVYTLESMLHSNKGNMDVCNWVNQARPGDVWAGGGEECHALQLNDAPMSEDRQEFFFDLLCVAIETEAISYWAVIDKTRRTNNRGENYHYLSFECRDDWKHAPGCSPEEFESKVMTPALLNTTINQLFFSYKEEQGVGDHVLGKILSAYVTNESSVMDIHAVDILIQVAMFGKVMYS